MPPALPPPLTVAASLVFVQGLILSGLGIREFVAVDSSRVTVGLTTGLFFLAYGLVLLAGSAALTRRRTWPRGPILITQFISLLLAFDLRSTVVTAVILAVSGLIVLAGMLHPDSLDALSRDRDEDDDEYGRPHDLR